MPTITNITTRDARFPLKPGEGSDAVHQDPCYSFAVTLIETDGPRAGTGLAFTLGKGNDVVCRAIELLAEPLVGREIEALMADWGRVSKELADHSQLRWLGPHKGVIHLALASLTNACFDLWAKTRGLALWDLLLQLSSDEIVNLLDLSWLEDVLTRDQAVQLIEANKPGRGEREEVITHGYPGYDTSVGWMNYEDQTIADNAKAALDQGFTAMKLKVGSADPERDLRRTSLIRETVGDDVTLMVDANQQWSLPTAHDICPRLAALDLYWIEEPTHPDDVLGHQALAEAIAPTAIALGEHVPHRVLFKNMIRAGAAKVIQVDCTRVAGVSEFITVSLLARQFGLDVVPHVGETGQIHQHLVLFNHVVLGHRKLFLEHIPHLRDHFVHPVAIHEGKYQTPNRPGADTDLHPET